MANKTRNKKKKVVLVFDESNRKEFLGGFRKRKNERRKKAVEDLKLQLKEETKRIKQEVKDRYKTMTKSYQPIPELDEFLEGKEEEYDTGDVCVKVVELNAGDLGMCTNAIGQNHVTEEEEQDQAASAEESSDEEDGIPGMEINPKAVKKRKLESDNEEEEDEDRDGKRQKLVPEDELPKSKKEMNKILKRQATSSLKKTKAFQVKRKMDKLKDKKKFRRDRNQKARTIGSKKHAKKLDKFKAKRRNHNNLNKND